ncbi:MAG: type II toxin-antitoxin system PemK/MazF family toxin [Coriobacteriia bacterium]|nr:type II toxin-antitoxin system PemK/MazF family toxin [Coriobacteriia bacterium]
MTASNQAQPFEIWLVYLHFIDRPKTGKVRPVLIVGIEEDAIAVAKITSKPPVPDTGDISITQWQEAGLNVPSTVCCSQVFEISPEELLRDAPIGTLQELDIAQVTQEMTELGYFQ